MIWCIRLKSLLIFFGMFVKISRSFKFFLLGILLLLLVSCSLKKLSLNQDVTFKLPSDIKRISKEELDKNTKSYQAADNFFVYKGIFLALGINTDSRLEAMTLERHLAVLKYDWRDLVKIESLEIRTVKGERFIVMDHYNPRKQLNVYTFFNDHERNRIVVSGFIQYDKATQKNDADKLLEVVLSSLKGK